MVFIDHFNRKVVVFGLRKIKDFYIPTTMYIMKNNNDQYNLKPRCKITGMEWVDY